MTNSKGKILWENVAAEFPLNTSFLNNDLYKLKKIFTKKEIDFNIVNFNSENERKKEKIHSGLIHTSIYWRQHSTNKIAMPIATAKINEFKI